MNPKNTQTITALIRRSVLLTEDRKAALLSVLPTLTFEQETELLKLLQSEDQRLDVIAENAALSALKQDNTEILDDITSYLIDAEKSLRTNEEAAEKAEEDANLESLFDDI